MADFENRTESKALGGEVASHVVAPMLQELLASGADPELLFEGMTAAPQRLAVRTERIDWSDYKRFMENVSKHYWTKEDFIQHGLSFFRSPGARMVSLVVRHFYSAEDFYRLGVRRLTRLSFACIQVSLEAFDDGGRRLEIVVSMEPGYEFCEEYLWVTHGTLIANPEVLGLPPAEVEQIAEEGQIRFIIHTDPRLPLMRRIRRFLTRPFRDRDVQEELLMTNELLQKRYLKLEAEMAERRRISSERESLVEELQAKNEQLEQFAYTVSHDLKSPLVTILGILDFLEKDIDQADKEKIARDIFLMRNAAETLKHLLEDLLELSRIGRVTGVLEATDLTATAQEAVRLLDGRIQTTGVAVRVAEKLPTIQGDPRRLLQVFLNLIDNAIKFAGEKEGGEVEIGIRQEDEREVVFVRDDGPGIETDQLERIFGLFTQLDVEKEGTGIGLTLVRRIVEYHGGRIWAESKGPGSGATFCMAFDGVTTLGESEIVTETTTES